MTFSIDNHDYSAYVVENAYEVNQEEDYAGTEYQDGWWKRHRTVARTRVNGTIKLALKPSELTTIITNLASDAGPENDHSVTLYVNNQNADKTISAYVTIMANTAFSTSAYNKSAVFCNAEVTIEER